VQDTVHQLCQEVEALLPGVICTVMRIDPAGLLDPLAAPSLPAELSGAIGGLMMGPDAGSCGRAAYLRQPVFVTDISADPKWAKLRDLALAAGLKACWSAPITGQDGKPVGALALYFREPRSPLEPERTVIAQCVELCEIALRRHERVADRERRASVDGLTRLPNRAAFNMALASMACDAPGSWALFIVDLDNLKTVNDLFGHPAGDGLIRAAGERIAAAMLPDVTFRLGGDEFAVIVQYPEALTDLEARAGRIFAALEAPADCDGHVVVPAATIGGAVLAGNAAADVYQNADFALYHAKETGRGGFVRYWPGIGSRITHRLDAIRDVTAALAEGRIDAYYQPVVRLDTREIVGVEALCRPRTAAPEGSAARQAQARTSDGEVAPALRRGTSWKGVPEALGAHGWEIKPRGAGLVIGDPGLQLWTKAGNAGRDLSFKPLTDRLGRFEPVAGIPPQPRQPYQARPMQQHPSSAALFAEYQRQKQARLVARRQGMERIKAERESYRAQLKSWQATQRMMLRVSGKGATRKRPNLF